MAKPIKFLNDFYIEAIPRAVANLYTVSLEIMDQMLGYFEIHLVDDNWISQGDIDLI